MESILQPDDLNNEPKKKKRSIFELVDQLKAKKSGQPVPAVMETKQVSAPVATPPSAPANTSPVPTPAPTSQRKPISSTPEQKEDAKDVQDIGRIAKEDPELIEKLADYVTRQLANKLPEAVRLEFEDRKKELIDQRNEAIRNNTIGERADRIIGALTQLAAGAYGYKHGLDLSGAVFQPQDWDAKYKQILGKYDQDRKAIDSDEQLATDVRQEDPNSLAAQALRLIIRRKDNKGQYTSEALSKLGAEDLRKILNDLSGEEKLSQTLQTRESIAGSRPVSTKEADKVEKELRDNIVTARTNQRRIGNVLTSLTRLLETSDTGFLGAFKAKLGGLGLFPTEAALDAQIKDDNLRAMVSMFAGMSRAIDSDAERRFFEVSRANIANNPSANLVILLEGQAGAALQAYRLEEEFKQVQQRRSIAGLELPAKSVTLLYNSEGEAMAIASGSAEELKRARAEGYSMTAQQAYHHLVDKIDIGRVKNKKSKLARLRGY